MWMWAIYALLSAFFAAGTDPIAKKALKGSDEYVVGWSILVFSIPFLAIASFYHKTPPLNIALIKTLLFLIPFEILATVLYYKALKLTDISLSVPFLALTPVFAILTSFIFLGESIKLSGIIGIILITIGFYSLNIKEIRGGFMKPFKAILSNKGSIYMAFVGIIFSITATIAKKAMLYCSPEAIPLIYNTSIALAMAPIVLYRIRKRYSHINSDPRTIFVFLALGLLAALSSTSYFRAISLTNVAYVISIKRLSLLMSVGYGWLFFKERDIHIRLLSTFCMLLGVIIILLVK